jgi:hypothetical protein
MLVSKVGRLVQRLTRSRNSGVADGLPNSAIGNATDIVGTFIYFVD